MSKCLNCGKDVIQTDGKRERKYCDNKGACKQQYWLKQNPKKVDKAKTVELPADFLTWKSIGIIKPDGTVEELRDISQLPEAFRVGVDAFKQLGDIGGKATVYKNTAETNTATRTKIEQMIWEEEQKILNNKNK